MDILQLLLDDLKRSATNVPYPLQQDAANWIASTYRQNPSAGLGTAAPDYLANALSGYGPAGNLQEVQNLILSSHYGTIGEFAQNILQKKSGRFNVGEAFSEAIAAASQGFCTYDPTRGSITNHLVNNFRDTLTGAVRAANKSTGMSGGLLTEDPIGDPYRDAWAGAVAPGQVAPTLPPPTQTWIEQLYGSLSGGRVPTGLYAPGGQFIVNGQLNPGLSLQAGAGQQVWIGQEELGQWMTSAIGGIRPNDALSRMVERSLRGLSGGMQGADTVGGNALGDNMQELDAALMAGERGARFLDSLAQGSPEQVALIRRGVDTNMRSRTLDSYFNPVPQEPVFDAAAESVLDINVDQASADLANLAATPGQRLAAQMAREMRVTGRIGSNFMQRNQNPALRAENAAAYQQLRAAQQQANAAPVSARADAVDPDWSPSMPMPEEPRSDWGAYTPASGGGGSNVPPTPPPTTMADPVSGPGNMRPWMVNRLRSQGFSDAEIATMPLEDARMYAADALQMSRQSRYANRRPEPTPPAAVPATPAANNAPPVTWQEQAIADHLAASVGTPTPASLSLSREQLQQWSIRAAGSTFNTLGGFTSSRLGTFQALTREGQGYGHVTSGQIVSPGGQVELSPEGTQLGFEWGQRAVQNALSGPGLEGKDAVSAISTVKTRVMEGIRSMMDDYVKAAKAAGPEFEAAAKMDASKIREVANYASNQIMAGYRGDLQFSGNTGDFSYNALWVGKNAKQLEAYMRTNPELEQWVQSQGGVQAVLSNRQMQVAGDQMYNIGGESGGWDGSGFGGGTRHKSPYQTDYGRLMMSAWMAQMAWNNTGGAVMKAADAYGMSQYSLLPLFDYGEGAAGGAVMYASQKQLSEQWGGRLAYQQYGILQNAGYAFGGGWLGNGATQIGQGGMVGAGAGLAAGIGAYGLSMIGIGAAAGALPIGIGVGAAVGTPLLGMAAYNAFTGRTPEEGLSFANFGRAWASRNAAILQNPFDFGAYRVPVTGTELDQYIAQRFEGQSEIDVIRKGLGSWVNNAAPNLAATLAGPPPQQRALEDFAYDLSNRTGYKFEDIAKQLSGVQVMTGGLDQTWKKDLAERLITLSQDTGQDQISIANQLASMRGLAPGTKEYTRVAQQYAGLQTNTERNAFQLQAQHAAQAFSQYAPYLQGTTYDASQLYYGLNMNMPQAQSFASIAAGVAMSQQSELTTTQQWNLGALSQQLGKYSTMVGGWAGQLDQLGVMNYEQAYTRLGGMVNGGMDPMYFRELMGGNRYAWNQFGRERGIGVLQTLDNNGLQAGTTDVSGLLLYAQQKGLGSSLAGLGVSDVGYQQALMTGGEWGAQDLYRTRMQGFQQQQFALQSRQIESNAAYQATTWGISQEQSAVSWASQQFGMAQSQKQFDLSNQFWEENWRASQQQSQAGNQYQNWANAFNYQTQLMQRGWARENYAYQQQMSGMQFGWNMEDINEQIRRSSGYERAQLIKQRDRMTTTYGLESSHAEEEMERQEKLWKRQDEAYQKQMEYSKQLQKLDEERFEREKRQHDAMAKIEQENLDERKRTAEKLHELEQQLREAQHQHDLQQLEFSREGLQLQKDMNAEQYNYQKSMEAIQRVQAQMAADWQRMASYAPALRDLLNLFFDRAGELNGAAVGAGSNILHR